MAVFLIALVEMVFFIVVSTTYENAARAKLTGISKEITRSLQTSSTTFDEVALRYRGDGVTVFLFTVDGDLIAPEKEHLTDEQKKTLKETLSSLSQAEVGVSIRKGGTLFYADDAQYQGQNCFVVVSFPLVIVRDTVKTLQLYFIIIGVLVLALAMLISYTFSQKLTRGLQSMSDTAVKMAKGDYTVKFANADYKEMAQLSDTLNYVRDEVKKCEDFQHEILANVSHDLKTPLTMIKAYASMIKEISGDNKEKREKHLQVIIDEADRLTCLVNDVLSVSKLQANIDEINPKVFNLTELVYGIINRFEFLQETQGYNIMVDIEQNLYTRADESKISQVIYNLVGNAANYTGEDKTVYVQLKQSLDGKRIKLSVRDTGKGISKEQLPEIWDRYYRVKESHSRPVKGAGLGLNIVKVILSNHAFDFGVESEKGKGSTFWVDFPSVPAEIDVSE